MITYPIHPATVLKYPRRYDVDKEILKLLADPVEPGLALELADKTLLDRLNASINKGQLKDRGGNTITTPLAEALVNSNGTRVYPVENDIPILLINRGIELETLDD